MTDRQVVVEAVRQMIEGEDYTPLDRLLSDITPDQAVRVPRGSPYSLATVVWHTWFWLNVWLVAIRGDGDPFGGHDPDSSWPEVAAEDWPATRERLFHALEEAASTAATEDLERTTWHAQTVGHNLLQIAVHSAYHIGQIALIRQELGLWPPRSGE